MRVAFPGAASFAEVAHIPSINAHLKAEVVALFAGNPVIRCSLKGRAAESYDVITRTPSGQSRWLSVSIVVLRGRGAKST